DLRILMEGGDNFLKAGVTLKYLQGAGTNFLNAPSVTGSYNAETEMLTTTGALAYGNSEGFDSDDIDFSNLTSGFGADLGVVYEYRPNAGFTDDHYRQGSGSYKWKVGISITDIGSIKYTGSTLNSYDLNSSILDDSFEDRSLQGVLEEYYEGTEELTDADISLPTAAHLLVDYRIRNNLFLAVQCSVSLVG